MQATITKIPAQNLFTLSSLYLHQDKVMADEKTKRIAALPNSDHFCEH